MKLWKYSSLLGIWFVWCGMVITPTGGTFTVTYTEPTLNSDGSALTDLSYCNVYSQVPNGSAVKGSNVTASASTGGGVQSPSVSVTWGAVPSRALPISFYITCTDSTGNETAVGSVTTVIRTVDPYPLLVP